MSAPLQIKLAMSDNARSRPVLSGQVAVEGVELDATTAHPSDIFWRQLSTGEFDISEMSLSSLAIMRASGRDDFVALPVFPVRRFFHAGILVREAAGLRSPKDLAGARVGVPEYQQTAAVWVRGYLSDEAGVKASDMEWFMERPSDHSHLHATEAALPSDVRLSHIAADESIASMLANGGIDAALHYIAAPTGLDRSGVAPDQIPGVTRLFADPEAEAAGYYAATGIMPMNHCVTIRRDVYDAHPWLVSAFMDAFARARRLAAADLEETLRVWRSVNAHPTATGRAATHPYGVEPNRPTLEALFRYLDEQSLVAKRPEVEGFFVADYENEA